MSEIEKIRLFDNKKIRTIWVEEEEDWYFSVKDVVTILTETTNARQLKGFLVIISQQCFSNDAGVLKNKSIYL